MIGPTVASFSLCLLAMLALRPVAIALDLIDRPGGRKIHHGDVPVVGGIAMLLGIIVGCALVPMPEMTGRSFLAACALLVVVGLLDDRFDLSPWTRLPAQIAAALLLIAGSDTAITTFLPPFGELDGVGSYALTVVVMIAAINAFNMLDGIDGLAGAVGIIALAAIAFLALDVGASVLAATTLTILGALSAFLISNVPARFNRGMRCFMGDSGSTLLGLAVAWLAIKVSQPPVEAASPVTLLWIAALPLFDFVWTILRRVLRGVSPLRADDEHLHHLLLKRGFRIREAFALCVALSLLLALVGLTLDRTGQPELVSFLLLTGTGFFVIRVMYQAHLIRAWLPIPVKSTALSRTKDGRGTTG